MKIFLLVAGILLYLIAIVWIIIFTIKTKRKIIQDGEKFRENLYKEYNEKAKQEYTNQRELYLNELKDLSAEIAEKQNFNTSLLKMREDELDRLMEVKRSAADEAFAKEIDDTTRQIQEWTVSAQEAMNFQISEKKQELNQEIQAKNNELNIIKEEIEDYRAKQNTINEAILRARALEEKENFYRIQLPENSKHDINYLLSIIDNFNNKEIIYKLIWSEYIQKPFKSMLNRILENKDPRNVIYMIKNLKTNEIYIGKTKAEVSKRWTEHIKTSLNIGSISKTKIHPALFNHWDDFSFSVLEEIPENINLNEREKYYIDFYQSDIYGYNIKSGG